MQNIVEKGVFGYTIWPENYEELVSQWMKRRYGQETKNEWVVFSPRINMALNMAVETFTNEGDGIVLHTPAYTALQNACLLYTSFCCDNFYGDTGEYPYATCRGSNHEVDVCG